MRGPITSAEMIEALSECIGDRSPKLDSMPCGAGMVTAHKVLSSTVDLLNEYWSMDQKLT